MATSLRYRMVDVFTDRPLAGNALCVVLDDCPERERQALAREVNLSETTFPTITGPQSYDMRIHTPSRELPFAGHPSIGTAWVLGEGSWIQTTPGATVQIDVDAGGAEMGQPDPTFVDADGQALADAVGLAGSPVRGASVASAAGNSFAILALDDEADVGRADPDLRAVARYAPLFAVIGRVDDRNLHVRVFAPGAGITEDPGTGSAAGPIGMFARQVWGLGANLTISQGSEVGRPCRIEVTADPGSIRVGGRVAAFAEGRLSLPE